MGSGYRTFTAGEILTASNVQNYLQDQAVMVFSGTAARSSAIGTANFEEGMLTYLTDVDKLQVYTGAAFEDVYPAAASNQGLTLINTTSFSAVASQSITQFSATYENYRIIIRNTAQTTTNGDHTIRMRSGSTDASGSDYFSAGYLTRVNSGTIGTFNENGSTSYRIGDGITTETGIYYVIDMLSPFLAQKTGISLRSSFTDTTARCGVTKDGIHNLTNSYDGFTLLSSAGTMTGKVSIYGYNF